MIVIQPNLSECIENCFQIEYSNKVIIKKTKLVGWAFSPTEREELE